MPEPAPGNMQEERAEVKRPTLKELHPKENLALAIGLAVLAACQPAIEATPTPTPTIEPTAVPTEVVPTPTPEVEQEPTPTVVSRDISLLERQFGGEVEGRTSELFVASYREEEQRGFKSTLENGQVWFVLGIYPELPEFDLEADLDPAEGNEVVYYTNPESGERMVFLTARAQSEESKEGLPFFNPTQTTSNPYGSFYFVKEGRIAGTEEAFVSLAENEVSVAFNREAGRYEFKDEAGEVTRTIEVYNPTALPEVISVETVKFVEWTPEQVETALIDSAARVEEKILSGEDPSEAFLDIKTTIGLNLSQGGEVIEVEPLKSRGWIVDRMIGFRSFPEDEDIVFRAPVGGVVFANTSDTRAVVGVSSSVLGNTEYAWGYSTLRNVEIIVSDGQEVEAGEPLFILRLGPESVLAEEVFHSVYGIPDVVTALFIEANTNFGSNHNANPREVYLSHLSQLLTDNDGSLVVLGSNK